MHRSLVCLSVALGGNLAWAQDSDLPHSAACSQALQTLQRLESTAAGLAPQAAQQRAALARVEGQRDQAARDCLGGRPASPPPSQHLAQVPISVPSVFAAIRSQPSTMPANVLPSLPQRPAPAPTVQGCDATGCLSSDGSRLLRLGPNLLGPRGVCSVQGALLNCP